MDVFAGLGFVLELFLFDQLKDVFARLPSHEIGHVPAFFSGAFEVHEELVGSVRYENVTDHPIELKSYLVYSLLHGTLVLGDLLEEVSSIALHLLIKWPHLCDLLYLRELPHL